MFHPVWRLRPRPYQAHFASHYVPKLRQFRETELGKKSFIRRQIARVSIDIQTVHPEGAPILTAATFFKKYSSLVHVQTSSDKREHWSTKNKKQRSPNHVHFSLQFHAQRGQGLLFQ